eukprot:948380-Ditylum_brightwellii.AAC.1
MPHVKILKTEEFFSNHGCKKQKKQATLDGAQNSGVVKKHGSSPHDAIHSEEKGGEDTNLNA